MGMTVNICNTTTNTMVSMSILCTNFILIRICTESYCLVSTPPIYFILECFKFFYSINLKKIICTFFRYITFICPHACRHHTQTYRYSKQYTKYSFSHLV